MSDLCVSVCLSVCLSVSLSVCLSACMYVCMLSLGASALLSNGTVFAPAGTGMIACLAKNRRVPVIFAAESYKFCDKVQLDSIVHNELGDYRELLMPDPDSKDASVRLGLYDSIIECYFILYCPIFMLCVPFYVYFSDWFVWFVWL